MRYGQNSNGGKCGSGKIGSRSQGGKCRSGKCGSRSQGWKMQKRKMWEQIAGVENAGAKNVGV